MAFKLCALALVLCVAAVRSAFIQQNALPVPMTNVPAPEVAFRIPDIPFQTLPSQGVTIQQDDVQLLGPEDKIIPLEKLSAIAKVTGLIAKLKLKGLKVLKYAIQCLGKLAVVGVILFSMAAVASMITGLFCHKTGLCTFTLNKFHFDKEHVDAVRSLLSDEHLSSLTKFVMHAIDEHSKPE